MRLETSREKDVSVLSFHGRLVAGVGDVQLRDAINELLAKGEKKILVDLTNVTHIDSSGVGELVASRRICHRFGGALKFVRGGSAVERVLNISQILPLFSFYPSVPQALDAFERLEASSDEVFQEA
jgi:anti-sigma B factor antagonist